MKRSAYTLGVLGILAIALLASGCHSTSTQLSSWHNELVLTFNGHEYQVTSVTTNNAGSKIGSVSYHGRSYVYELYSIKGVEDYKQIAVRTRDGFLMANIGKSLPLVPST